MKLSGNTILITGGTSGIGYEMAKEFIKNRNTVIVTGRNEQKLQKVKNELKGVVTIKSDVSNPDDVKALYEHVAKDYPSLNVLVNNAGIMTEINLQKHQLSATDLTKEIDIIVKGNIWMNDAFIPLLMKNRNPATVTVSSMLAFVPLAITPVYWFDKAALPYNTLSLK